MYCVLARNIYVSSEPRTLNTDSDLQRHQTLFMELHDSDVSELKSAFVKARGLCDIGKLLKAT